MGVIVYGQAPGKNSPPGAAPFSGGRTGALLEELAGVPLDVLQREWTFVNVLPHYPGSAPSGVGDAFPMSEARAQALAISDTWVSGDRIVLCGRNVARSFGWTSLPYLSWERGPFDIAISVFPHPSGLNRWWNDLDNRVEAAMFLRDLVRRSIGEVAA